jgi:hypothetical protein
VARYAPTRTGKARWQIDVPRPERKRTGILGIMDQRNSSIATMRVFRNMEYRYPTSLKFAMDSDWLRSGEPLEKVAELFEVLTHVRAA